MIEPLMQRGDDRVLADQQEMEELQNDPEVQAHINQMILPAMAR